jgi:Transcriptional regulator/sugar kinase
MIETIIGIDLGGTRIKAVAINAYGKLLDEQYQSTKDGDDETWKKAVADLVIQWKNKWRTQNLAIGISAPGLPNTSNSAIAFMPGRLQGLENFEWSSFLQLRSFVLNDAVAAMIAEARFGAAKDRKNIVMITLGTGVGGAILINGQPYLGAFGKAGHIGHMVINDEGQKDICGMPGSLEDAIGNVTVSRRSGGRFTSTQELLKAYREGDEKAAEVWLTSVKKLAIGLASLTNILSPETIVLGGGISEAGADLFDPLETYMNQYEWRTGGNKTSVVKAQFGEKAGAIGAACFALEKTNIV